MAPHEIPDPDEFRTVVDPRPEADVIAGYGEGQQPAQVSPDAPTAEEPLQPGDDEDDETPKKKGGLFKKLIIGCGLLGCLGVVAIVVVAIVGVAVAWFAMGDDLTGSWSEQLTEVIEQQVDQAMEAAEGAGEAVDEGAGEAVDEGAGEAVDEGASEAVDEGAGEAVDEGAGEADEDQGDTEEPPTEAQDDGVAEEITPREEPPTPREEPTPYEEPPTPAGPVSLVHSPASMAVVGDSVSVSATTPGERRCKVVMVYSSNDGSWKQKRLSRSGDSHTGSLTVTAEMSPEFSYYLTAAGCGSGRSPEGSGSYSVKVF